MSGSVDDSYAEAWLRWFPVIEGGAAPLTARMLELVDIDSASDVLDLGTGIGEPALTAAARLTGSGRVTAIDRDTRMLEHARNRAQAVALTNVAFEAADIDRVEPAADAFDVVLARWSLMFVEDLSAVLNRLHRGLRAGGRIALATWARPEQVPALTLARRVAAEVRDLPAPVYGPGSPFCLWDATALAARLEQAGYSDVHSEAMPVVYRYETAEAYIRARIDLTGPLWEGMETGGETTRRIVFDAITEALEPFRQTDGHFRLENRSLIVTARAS